MVLKCILIIIYKYCLRLIAIVFQTSKIASIYSLFTSNAFALYD